MIPIDSMSQEEILIRDATDADADQIRDIYHLTYGDDYAYPQYYDVQSLKKAAFADDNIMLVAEETATGLLLGTASVLLDVGAFGDLAGEFGRLAVRPDARQRGIGKLLMQGRLERVQDRLHIGLVDNRVAHLFSQKISAAYGFVPVGLSPKKLKLTDRESVCLFVRHFGDALSLRRNNPHLIPEAHRLAELALSNCGLPCDAIVDDTSAPYPHLDDFGLEHLTSRGYSTLLRFERGRVSHRDIFGPVRLHYGLFQLKATHSNYLIAREGDRIVGAIGLTLDEVEKAVRIFELVSRSERPIRFLLDQLVHKCRDHWGIEYIEVDVNAFSPSMQRTLLELDFLPVAYIPALAFHEVERLDAVKMARLLIDYQREQLTVIDQMRPIADLVLDSFAERRVLPQIARAAGGISLFADLTKEQLQRVAGACSVATYSAGDPIIVANQRDGRFYIVLHGQVEVTLGGEASHRPVGEIGAGECLGEMSLLCSAPHSATATAVGATEVAVLAHSDLRELVRRRPDIGVVIYHNLAVGLGEKLWRSDQRLFEQS